MAVVGIRITYVPLCQLSLGMLRVSLAGEQTVADLPARPNAMQFDLGHVIRL